MSKVKELTPWQAFFEKDYIGSHSFEEGEEKTVTIKYAESREVTQPGGRKTTELVVVFKEEGIKPLVCGNVINNKSIQRLNGSRFVENWPGTKLTLYVDPKVKNPAGDQVGGIRIKQPETSGPQKDHLSTGHPKWNDCVEALRNKYTMEHIRFRFNVSAETEEALLEAAAAKKQTTDA